MNRQTLRSIIVIGLFLIPFTPFLVSSSFFFPFITTKAFFFRTIVEIIFTSWLLLAFLDVNYRPKKSLILSAILCFLVVIGLADLLGVEPARSFWSNFERMEGFVTLLHLGAFFVVIGSVFSESDWKKWWNTSLVASFLMVLYCLLQITGLKTINQGGVRVDGTLGNAIYLAVYMLFHAFIAILFIWREWKNVTLRWVYGLLILAQIFILYFTATRGAIIGFLAGLLVVGVLNLRNKDNPGVRKTSLALLSGLVLLIGIFWVARDTSFVASSPVLSRFANITTQELTSGGRSFVWPMAWEGFKDRPILGWGQENFNYVFNKYYDPEMFRLEPWFDRAHNIFLDWAVAGGALGLLSYLSLYLALLLGIWRKASPEVSQADFSYTEKSILTGLITAYFFHNFFVFDHLVSYVFFFSLLAYVYGRNGGELFWKRSISETGVKKIALPAVLILLVLSLYFVNIKPIMGNVFLIEALKAVQTPGQMSKVSGYFQKSYRASKLGRAEVIDHLSMRSLQVFTSDISMEEKNDLFVFAKDAIIKQTQIQENDARYELLAGSFLSSVGLLDEALEHLGRAKELMPGKQQIYFEIGAVYINKKEPALALEAFRQAYEMAPDYDEAKIIYLIGAIYAGDRALEASLLAELPEGVAKSDERILSAYKIVGR